MHGSEAAWLRPATNPDTVDIGEMDEAANPGIVHVKKTGSAEVPGITQKPDQAGNPENTAGKSLGRRACETKRGEESRYLRTKLFWEQRERQAKEDRKEHGAKGK